MKNYYELDFTDDFMFCKVLTEHPELCKRLAELFTGRKVRKLGEVRNQLTVEMLKNGKGVRFDVWFEDDADTVYDFEMQTTIRKNLPRRTRYYQSILDVRRLKSGKDYRELPDSYIIFICMEDPFDKGYRRYTFRNICVENHSLYLCDGAEKVFINACGTDDSGNKKDMLLQPFLDYLRGREPKDNLTKEIDAAVREARADEEGMVMYMTMEEHYEEQREAGRAEGRAEAMATLSANLLSSGICKTHQEAEEKAVELLKKKV